jgi:4-amino-4-deoxy-L-arabinose transferase-like glycosyltransferase
MWTRFSHTLADHPIWLLCLAAIIFLALGFSQDGINLDSTTYSVVARNMAEHNNWFNPSYTAFYHLQFAEHPPLVMWAQALIFLLFGASDPTARLFGALCTFGSIIFVYLLGKEIKSKALGFIAGLVLLLTYNFMQQGNSTLLDVPMTCFILAVLWGMARLEKGTASPALCVATGLALAGAFLSKGLVSAPVWIALVFTALFLRRDWLKMSRFWLIPVAAVSVIAFYLFLDLLYSNGRFTTYYFATQVWSRFLGESPEVSTRWYEFIYRFVKLYLPFVILLPVGLYMTFRRNLLLLYPTAVTLLFYFLFYSTAAKLYYHYFCPAYALAALFVALPIARLLSPRAIRLVSIWFSVIWLALAIAVTVADVRIHEIRGQAVYSLTESMQQFLSDKPSRQGLMVSPGQPDWDYVAKTSWYWRSDIKQTAYAFRALKALRMDESFSYILVRRSHGEAIRELAEAGLVEVIHNDDLAVYSPADR